MEANKVTKETLTFILLMAVVIVTLGLLLYDFIPTETEMPDTLEYVSEAKVTSTKQAIADAGYKISDDGDSLLRSYTVTQTDLDMYEAKKSYKSGKINPFEAYQEPENVVNGNTTNTAGGSGSTTPTNTTPAATNQITPTATNTTSSQGTFFEKPNSK